MDPFEAWVRTAPSASVQRYKDELLKLGANFDSFKREASEVVDDLVCGGIPRMAARDVYGAVAEAIAMRSVPLAVFWDVENLPVPSACTGRYVASRLKSVLAEYGDLVEFRGYASIGLNNIPEEKRSDLHLSGCHLVDCPHNGRKEVADKMIIVDAMDFVIDRPDGAVLCFITGDTDYAYLLAKLQKRKTCRTIVISRGTADSMLHVSCDVKLQWETDILQVGGNLDRQPAASSAVGPPPGFPEPPLDLIIDEPKPESTTAPKSYASAAAPAPVATAPPAPSNYATSKILTVSSRLTASNQTFTVEFAKELMQQAIMCTPVGARVGRGCLKSAVGGFIRMSYPLRFPDRAVVKEFLAFAIESGVVVESGEKQYKVLTLPGSGGSTAVLPSSPIQESPRPPLPIALLPTRVLEMVSSLPFVIFIPWALCPDATGLPKWTFVQSYEYLAILMYKSKVDALNAVDECPQLRRGTLVDWRQVAAEKAERPIASPKFAGRARPVVSSTAADEFADCRDCDTRHLKSEMYRSVSGIVCESCFVFADEDVTKAQKRVCDLLEMLAENDDIYVFESVLAKSLCLKHPDECASRKQAARWIKSAVNGRLAALFKIGLNWCVCLFRNYRAATGPFPSHDLDTSAEENHVVDLLWESPGAWLTRSAVGKILASTFERMSTAYMRNKVFLNAHKKRRIFVAKSEYGHAVALTERDAHDALRFLLPPLSSVESSADSDLSNADGPGETSSTSSDDNSSA